MWGKFGTRQFRARSIEISNHESDMPMLSCPMCLERWLDISHTSARARCCNLGIGINNSAKTTSQIGRTLAIRTEKSLSYPRFTRVAFSALRKGV